ncbi:hypothetical protein POVCU1_024280 [Plasmodium ovale curtisi]|uniref:Uncharacterized protein n=1 Tax=Plasmodium ovale curtisi TaxID=864141 RepID=A0A1A8WM24_PLAOA|nr:hypothetical protein POVCU1_024280 [Plasmodium ovale curtisi]
MANRKARSNEKMHKQICGKRNKQKDCNEAKGNAGKMGGDGESKIPICLGGRSKSMPNQLERDQTVNARK